MSINWKSPKAVGIAVVVFAALFILTAQAVKLAASGVDTALPGKGYGAMFKGLFGFA